MNHANAAEMLLERQHFLIDIDNTITRYKPEASSPGATLFGNCFLPVIRDLMVKHGWETKAAETALFESVNDVLRWDYSELLDRFSVPWEEAAEPMAHRHRELLDVYSDTVRLIRKLKQSGAHLYIISNNPYWGCRWKLRRAGLEAVEFEHIFSTDHTGGCKSLEYVWKFALSRIGSPPERINTIGDDPKEDGLLPLSFGIGRAFILKRGKTDIPATDTRLIPLDDAYQVLNFFSQEE